MAMTPTNPEGLLPGQSLSVEDCKLLERGDWLLHDGKPVIFRSAAFTSANGKRMGLNCDGLPPLQSPSCFTFLGRPGADGFIPWTGGENPVPGLCVSLHIGCGIIDNQPSEKVNWSLKWRWRPSPSVEGLGALRPEDRAFVPSQREAIGADHHLTAEDRAVIDRCVERQPVLMMRGQHEGYYIHSDVTDLLNIIARLSAALSASGPAGGGGWQPIETAPKDGTNILAICGTAYSPEATVSWWSEGWTHYSRPEEKWHGGVGRWFPTHWQPLPEPPALSAPGSQKGAGE